MRPQHRVTVFQVLFAVVFISFSVLGKYICFGVNPTEIPVVSAQKILLQDILRSYHNCSEGVKAKEQQNLQDPEVLKEPADRVQRLSTSSTAAAATSQTRNSRVGSSEKSAIKMRIETFLKQNNCTNLYLDMGSNIGVQPRKLYEPACYPNPDAGRALAKFDSVFGPVNNDMRLRVCTIGFEANQHHTQKLVQVQNHLQRTKGAAIIFFTNTGITGHDGTAQFRTDNQADNNFWGAHLEDDSGRSHLILMKDLFTGDAGLLVSNMKL